MAATLVYVGPRLEQVRDEIAATLPDVASRVAISAWQRRLVVRLIAAETMWGQGGYRVEF